MQFIRAGSVIVATLVLLATLFPGVGLCQGDKAGVAQSRTQTIDDITFTLPNTLRVEKVAGEPLVHWPVVADWDAQGRLVVVESGGVERPIEEHNKQRLHRIVRLADDNGDGLFDSRTLAANDLPFTEGVLCLGNMLLVAAPPEILKLTDEDGDGFCEQREVWFDGQTITGCANDLHGPYLGLDGWIYWCKGAFAEQTHQLAGGKILKDKAAHIFRRRIEGGPIDAVISGGMDNPVEVAFTPEGEKFFSSTFLQHPADGRRDGLAHAVYGAVFGKDHDAINGLIRTGPLMPIMTHLGPAAPSGLTCLRSDWLPTVGSDVSGRTLVSAQFNLQKVAAHRLIADGSTYQTDNLDLLVANRVDFHPTDVVEEAFHGLLVVDTGGWYDLCCPTSRVDQRVASGGIYRIAPNAGPATSRMRKPPENFDWTSIGLERCIDLLDDPRPWISRHALLRLGNFANDALPRLQVVLENSRGHSLEKIHRVFSALSRIGTDEALAIIASEASRISESDAALTPASISLSQAACQLIALHRYQPARVVMQRLAGSGSPPISRAAIEALGRLGNDDSRSEATAENSSVQAIMSAVELVPLDRTLEHSMLYALIELEDARAVSAYLDSQQPTQQRMAMLTLEQLHDAEYLNRTWLMRATESPDEQLRTAAILVLASHHEWAGESIAYLNECWSRQEERSDELVFQIVRAWRGERSIQELVANWMHEQVRKDPSPRVKALLACWENESPPQAFIEFLATGVAQAPAEIGPILASLDLRSDACRPLVSSILSALHDCRDLESGRTLLSALATRQDIRNEWLVEQLMSQADYRSLKMVALNPRDAERILAKLPNLTPQQLPPAIEALAGCQDEQLNVQVLDLLVSLPAARTFPENFLANIYRTSRPDVRQQAAEVTNSLLKPTSDIEAAVQSMLVELEGGDPVRGLEIFRGEKASCSACHQMGYVGGRIGPELTRIGRTRTRSALAESLLFPSARIEQSYQSSKVLTLDGQVFNGLIRVENGSALVLQLAADRSISIPKNEIERIEPSSVSVMPTGLQSVLSRQELADILVLLESAK